MMDSSGGNNIRAFVRSRQGPPVPDSAFADQFKVPAPATRLGNQDINNGHQANAKANEELKGYTVDQDLFGTDAGSALDTTTDLEVDQNVVQFRSTPPPVQQFQSLPGEPGRPLHVASSERNDDDDELDDYDPCPSEHGDDREHIDYYDQDVGEFKTLYRHENPAKYKEYQDLKQQELALADANSYPDTTSGRITEQSEQDHKLPQAGGEHREALPDPGQLKPQQVTSAHAQLAVTQQQNQSHAPQQQAEWQAQQQHRERLQPAPAGPQFHKPQIRGGRQASPMPAPKQDLPLHQSNPRPREKANVTKAVDYEQTRPRTRAEHGERQAHAASSKVIQPIHPEVPKKSAKHRNVPVRNNDAVGGDLLDAQQKDAPAMDVEEVVELDYDESVLYRKDFSDLQKDDYDVDPREEPSPQGLSKDELESSISDLLKSEAGQQKAFFASLTLSQWEEAGDVIMDKFTDLMAELKKKRKEKRELSRKFEAKIAIRHKEISLKRKTTDDALKAMRGAGSHVLETPKKMKRKV